MSSSKPQGRYEHLDSDDHRLPPGMQRVGYDADEQTYTFQDEDGRYYDSEPGNRYGTLHPRDARPASAQGTKTSNHESRNYFAPFLLILVVVMVALLWFVNRPVATVSCGEGLERHVIEQGETCWAIAEGRGVSVERLKEVNSGLDCERLVPGEKICVPGRV